MLIWKLDAIHDLDGAFSRFFKRERDAKQAAMLLHGLGWFCDVYDEDVPELAGHKLICCEAIFPMADTETIVESVIHLYRKSKEQLR